MKWPAETDSSVERCATYFKALDNARDRREQPGSLLLTEMSERFGIVVVSQRGQSMGALETAWFSKAFELARSGDDVYRFG